jgi:hypothetical protein
VPEGFIITIIGGKDPAFGHCMGIMNRTRGTAGTPDCNASLRRHIIIIKNYNNSQ